MTISELISKRKEMEDEYYSQFEKISIQYADEHCPAKVGDIIRGNGGYIKVEYVRYCDVYAYLGTNCEPFCIFYGTAVNKEGTPYKSNIKKYVYPWALREVNGKKVRYEIRTNL